MAPILRAILAFLALVLLQGQLVVHTKHSSTGVQNQEQAFIQELTWISPSFNPSFCGTFRHQGDSPRFSQWIHVPNFKSGFFVNNLSRLFAAHQTFYPAFLEHGVCVIRRFGPGKQFLSNVCLWLI
jgi:hypothetical protein